MDEVRLQFPENFERLHEGEEFVRTKSIEAAGASADLTQHLEAIEGACTIIHHFIHRDAHKDDDDLAIRLLGMRLFNTMTGALRLLLSGYFQAATLLQRDLIETFFLLDYFSTDLTLVQRWRTADEKTLRDELKPVIVRMALDKRDGFMEKKRAASYKLFSSLAAHPNPVGFAMLRVGNGDHHCGPFFEQGPLIATLSELGRNVVQAGGHFMSFFTSATKVDFATELGFLETRQRWFKRFYEKDLYDEARLQELRDLIAQI
jgi:hypothetical protein